MHHEPEKPYDEYTADTSPIPQWPGYGDLPQGYQSYSPPTPMYQQMQPYHNGYSAPTPSRRDSKASSSVSTLHIILFLGAACLTTLVIADQSYSLSAFGTLIALIINWTGIIVLSWILSGRRLPDISKDKRLPGTDN